MTREMRTALVAIGCLLAVSACTVNGNQPMQANRSTTVPANGGGGGGSGGY